MIESKTSSGEVGSSNDVEAGFTWGKLLLVAAANMAYSSEDLVAESGAINISLANYDLFWHTFTIDELGVDLSVPVGSEREAGFSASPGTYTFYCTIPGHELLGMRGTLTILEAAE